MPSDGVCAPRVRWFYFLAGFLFSVMEGYFKVHRKILDSQVFAHQTALKIWIWCLAKVTFKERFVSLKIGKGETTVKLLPGQFLFGRFKAEEELNIDGSTIYKWIQKFASEQFEKMISIESNNQYSIITICNWEQYQNGDDIEVTTKEQPSNNQVAAEEQPSSSSVTQTIMYNNGDNGKKQKTWRDDFQIYLSECRAAYKNFMEDAELLKTQQRLNPGIDIKLSIEKGYTNFWSTEEGWKYKKGEKAKSINWKLTIINSIAFNKVYLPKQ